MDLGDSQQKTTSLLVKTPNQAQEDQIIEGVDVQWTVKDLKAHFSRVYPTKPAVSDQRLIFAGKLLPDHLHIKDLFRQTDSIPTLHLVCTMRNPPQAATKMEIQAGEEVTESRVGWCQYVVARVRKRFVGGRTGL
ncbi:hypothetical protein CRENBAI_023306 [Crenichthys baileyi]|uniref:Ubiquitin-like domain-containing protein n=1 Tax=Crenichthys baileyi TaxID=28760 RepID=A0AAV9R5U7_9TELE